MARTLVGILQILLKQDVTKQAPAINQAIQSIENQAKRIGTAAWGMGFQRQLDRLKVSPAEHAAITASYDRLSRDINGKINRADLAAWRQGTLAHLTQVRAGLKQTADDAKRMHGAIAGAKTKLGNLAKPALVALGAYTGWYAAGVAMREGFNAAGDRQREYFRQDMAGLNENEKAAIAAEAQRLTIQYPSVGMTPAMEMARTSRNTMGTTEDGLAILEDMVRGLVTLQSAQGPEAANTSMMRLVRALDNLGLNAGGEIGLASMREVMAGAIRAVQIEGGEIDVGQYLDFAIRSKIAGPALSDEFLATTAAAIMQDMTAQGAGTAIASAYQSLVVGSSAVASKVNLAEQRRLGLRQGEGGPQGYGTLVDAELYGQNPYQWVKKHLMPALAGDGVDMENEVAINQAIAKISRNTMATGLLARLVTQSPQIDRLIGLYGQAMGPDAADRARHEDPFVAAKGFTSALDNLASALGEHVMPVIVPALNAITDTVNSMASSIRVEDGWVVGLGALATVLGAMGALKLGGAAFAGIVTLGTAGPSLQTAATMLQGAATSLNAAGTGAAPVGGAGGKTASMRPGLMTWAMSLLSTMGNMSDVSFAQEALQNGGLDAWRERIAKSDEATNQWLIDNIPGAGLYEGAKSWLHQPSEVLDGEGAAKQPIVTPSVDTGEIMTAQQLLDSLNATMNGVNPLLAPKVDTSQLEAALDIATRLATALRSIGGITASQASSVRESVRDAYADYGIAP